MKGAYFHAFQKNGQIGHTCVWPQKLRWPRVPCPLNPSLVLYYLKCPKVVISTFFVIMHKNKDLVRFSLYAACIYLLEGKLAINMFILKFYLHAMRFFHATTNALQFLLGHYN